MDVASNVDYSKDAEVNDGVVHNSPTKVVNLTYAPSPSPLYKIKDEHSNVVRTPCCLGMTDTLFKGLVCISTWMLPCATSMSFPFLVP